MTALAKSAEDRFPTPEALAAALVPFASAEGANGPYSPRPSQRAFVVANEAMARAPVVRRATHATELLGLPTSRGTRRSARPQPRAGRAPAPSPAPSRSASRSRLPSRWAGPASTRSAARSASADDAPSSAVPLRPRLRRRRSDAISVDTTPRTHPPSLRPLDPRRPSVPTAAHASPSSTMPASSIERRRAVETPHARIERPLYL